MKPTEKISQAATSSALGALTAIFFVAPSEAAERADRRPLEKYPTAIAERLAQRDSRVRQFLGSDATATPFVVVVKSALRWAPGATITVAFESGDAELHKRVAEVANEWTNYANVTFDFGFDEQTQQYRTYSPDDDEYAADMRIAFGSDGNWSAVGKDSINDKLFGPGAPSMNLADIGDKHLKGVVLHEFGHALGAEHEHQHPTEGCDDEWRWDDEPGYISTTDSDGYLVADFYDRYPGVYTLMSGAPDYWSRQDVDYNLRQLDDSSAYGVGPFDKHSIMKYHFWPEFFHSGEQSRCYTDAPANELSEQDKIQIAKIYPHDPELVASKEREKAQIAEILETSRSSLPDAQFLIEHLSR